MLLHCCIVYSSGCQFGVREGTSWGASFNSLIIDISNGNTKNITLNGARGAKMIFPLGRGAGFKMN